MQREIRRYAIMLAAWLPFYVVWALIAVVYAHLPLRSSLILSLISIGTASLLGIPVWHICQRHPWPLRLDFRFYSLHVTWAFAYSIAWTLLVFLLEAPEFGWRGWAGLWKSPVLGWELLMGAWLYGLFAGISYAVQTRNRLHEKEALAARAEALASAARLDAIRARLNPHFLFNALHTLSALVKFRPAAAEGAIERLGDMLRYTLKEDGRGLVEFSEEYEFTRQYISFEQLRYEERLKVDLQIDSESFHFDVPPFSMQTLAENAVRHAISVRPEGGSIWIACRCKDGKLRVTVRDDGPGRAPESHESSQFGLRSLRERLHAAYGDAAELRVKGGVEGFEACFEIPRDGDGDGKAH